MPFAPAPFRHPGPVPGSTVPRIQRGQEARPGGCRDKPGMTNGIRLASINNVIPDSIRDPALHERCQS
jgi:hypothetical protein